MVYNTRRRQSLEGADTDRPTQHPMPDDISQLNQHLDRTGKRTSLSWQESTSGLAHEPQWSCICKIDGIQRGIGVSHRKYKAKNLAAAEALQYLNGLATPSPPVAQAADEGNGSSAEDVLPGQAQDNSTAGTSDAQAAPDEISSENPGDSAGQP